VTYGTGNKFMLKEFDQAGEITKNMEFGSSTKDIMSRIKRTDFENFEHWYQDYFFSWIVLDARANANPVCLIQKITLD
jgi:hypothetical protein